MTAPYMLPVVDQFTNFYKENDIEITTADVLERMEEEDLLVPCWRLHHGYLLYLHTKQFVSKEVEGGGGERSCNQGVEVPCGGAWGPVHKILPLQIPLGSPLQ